MTEKLTYLQANVQNGRLIRWPDKCMPLTFYISPYRWYQKVQGEENQYYGLVTKALRAWEQASAGKVKFYVVNNVSDSQINLEWKRVDRQALGHCIFNYDDMHRLFSAEVQIGLSDGIMHAQYMSMNEVYHTILHEIGHALGLGHSPYKSDIMYTPHQYGNTALSQRDAYTIQWLYNFPCAVHINEASSRYRLAEKDFDNLVMKIVNDKPESEFERVKNSIANRPQKDLLNEQSKIAEIKRYQVIGLQNVQIPKDTLNIMQKNNATKKNEPNKYRPQ